MWHGMLRVARCVWQLRVARCACLHVARCMCMSLHVARGTRHAACYMWHAACGMLPAACCMWQRAGWLAHHRSASLSSRGYAAGSSSVGRARCSQSSAAEPMGRPLPPQRTACRPPYSLWSAAALMYTRGAAARCIHSSPAASAASEPHARLHWVCARVAPGSCQPSPCRAAAADRSMFLALCLRESSRAGESERGDKTPRALSPRLGKKGLSAANLRFA